MNIPHSEKRLVGYKPKKGDVEAKFNPAILREHIFGAHVAKYLKKIKAKAPEHDKCLFSKYAANGIEADKLEKLIKSVHEKIRADPEMKDPRSRKEKEADRKEKYGKIPAKFPHRPKMSLADRRNRYRQKLAAILAKSAKKDEE